MSDVRYDAELAERLEREAREDDATIRFVDDRFARPDTAWPECGHDEATCPCFTENDKARSVLAKAMLRTRDNLRALADQLAAARAEVGRLARYVEAQSKLLADNATVYHAMRRAHEAEVETLAATRREFDAYRAARDKAGR